MKTLVLSAILLSGNFAFAEALKDPVLIKKGAFELKCTEEKEDFNFQCKYPYVLVTENGIAKKYYIVVSSKSLPNSTPGKHRKIEGILPETSHSEICLGLGRKPEINGLSVSDLRISVLDLHKENAGLAAFVSRENIFIQGDAETLNAVTFLTDLQGNSAFAIIDIQGCGAKLGSFEKYFR